MGNSSGNPDRDVGGACCEAGQQTFGIALRVLRADDPGEEVVVYNCPVHGYRSPCPDTGVRVADTQTDNGAA